MLWKLNKPRHEANWAAPYHVLPLGLFLQTEVIGGGIGGRQDLLPCHTRRNILRW